RRRQRRQRLLVAGAVVATVAVLGTAAAVTPDFFEADGGPEPVKRSATPTASTPASTPASPTATPSKAPRVNRFQTLVGYNEVLAEHLDPEWRHLERLTKANRNEQVGTGGGLITSLGSKFGWRIDGEQGLGMVQISVNAGWS